MTTPRDTTKRDQAAELRRQDAVAAAVAEHNAAELEAARARHDAIAEVQAAAAAEALEGADDVTRAVAEHNAHQLEIGDAGRRAELQGDVVDDEPKPRRSHRSASWRATDAVSTVRQVGDQAAREIEGIAVPYGAVAMSTELGPEAFAPGAFRDSVAHWMARQDGARMAFRPAHGQPAIGTVRELRETPDGVAFRARIREGAAGDAYLADVADGLNGVSIEFGPDGSGRSPRRGRDGVTVHQAARLHAIAGSTAPAYDAARVSLRDLEDPAMKCQHCQADLAYGVAHDCPKDPNRAGDPHDDTGGAAAGGSSSAAAGGSGAAATAVADRDADVAVIRLDQRTRTALEAAGIRGLRGPSVRTTRAEAVYGPRSENLFFRDNFAATQGDWEAQQRQQKHYGLLAEIARDMERDAVWRMLSGAPMERAGDVLSSEIPGAYPNDYLPGLLTPRIVKGRPMADFYQRIPIADARPRIFPKVTTSTTVAVQSAEGAALSATDFATTAVTATPLMYGAYTDVSRQVLDGADPAAEAMLMQDLAEAYQQASEGVVKTAVEAGSTASGVGITAATPYAGAIANVVNYYTTRFKTAKAAFIPSAQFSTLLAQADTTGRPLVPALTPTNADGQLNVDGDQMYAPLLGARGTLAWQATANVWVFGVPSDFVIYESAVASFRYDQVVGPQAVRVGIWTYLVVGTRLGSLKVTAA